MYYFVHTTYNKVIRLKSNVTVQWHVVSSKFSLLKKQVYVILTCMFS